MASLSILWAVHISDGLLHAWVWLAGMGLGALLMVVGSWRLRDEEVPRVALLTAAFFVASSIHIPIGPKVHLLLNGLVGVILGRRAALAIPIGLLLQVVLFAHGGFYTLGINTCVMTLPALFAGGLFGFLHRLPYRRRTWFRGTLVTLTVLGCVFTAVFSMAVMLAQPQDSLDPGLRAGLRAILHPATLIVAAVICVVMIAVERGSSMLDFALGLFTGWLSVIVTVTLNFLVLYFGGEENWTVPALLSYIGHLPLAVLEGIVLGFTVGFLARVKPEMLGMTGDAGQAFQPDRETGQPVKR